MQPTHAGQPGDYSHSATDSQATEECPLIAVITPTWRRHEVLLGRCVPSVRDQDYPRVKHIVISDGPDDNLRDHFWQHPQPNVCYRELHRHEPGQHWGHLARLRAFRYTLAEFITYCDDDDALRPDHCSRMMAALLADPEAGFAVSRMMCHAPTGGRAVTGWGPLAMGNVGTPMIAHRRKVLEHGNWGPASKSEDWDLVERWLKAGVRYVNVDAETSDVYPGRWWNR